MKREPSICACAFMCACQGTWACPLDVCGPSHDARAHLLALPLLALGLEDVDDHVGGGRQDLRHGLVLALQDHQVLRLHLLVVVAVRRGSCVSCRVVVGAWPAAGKEQQ